MTSDSENPFDELLTAVQMSTRLVASDVPLTQKTRADLAKLLRGLGEVLIEVEGVIAKLRRSRS